MSFQGLIHGLVILDEGTSIVRKKYIYDLEKMSVIDTLDIIGVYDDGYIKNSRYYYSRIITDKEEAALKLSKCENDNLEFSGYVELMYYDLILKCKKHTGKIDCIK